MVNTKVTSRKSKEICPVCFTEVDGKDAWTNHVLKCASSMLVCEKCHVSFKKKEYLVEHMKLKHAESDEVSKESSKDEAGPRSLLKNNSDSESDWDEDRGVQLEEAPKEKDPEPPSNTASLLTGRMFRKRTAPSPVPTTRKVVCRPELDLAQKSVDVGTQTYSCTECRVDQETQTARFRMQVKEVTVTKFHENGRSVENIVEREEFYNM
ncbi:uncharacterized protein LOC133178302 [Saccostrea echinata]|uniref:uncharacterized protein LOC133178302 n=1 Tax=Saccostrea echinata TaxID=191078 RepID=UPI002A813842|nr:uncharacterized protein LOC133178302 [Saccostrea echinata]